MSLSHSLLAVTQQHGFPRLTVHRIHRLLAAGLVSCEDVCAYCYALAVAGEESWKLHAFERLVHKDDVLDRARHADERRRHDGALSFLDGIPVSIKANLAVASLPLTAGSRILGASATTTTTTTTAAAAVGYDAAVTESLLTHCGAVLIGCTTLDEFGMGSLGTNVVVSGQGGGSATRNPLPLMKKVESRSTAFWDDYEQIAKMIQLSQDAIYEAQHAAACSATTSDASYDDAPFYSAGGSSCGSAVSVAHGSSIVSLGSDTGGSVRLPAAWCGITGLKPSYGLLSRHGLVSYASSMDTIGILAPTVGCAATALHCLLSAAQQHQTTIRDSTQTAPPKAYLSSIHAAATELGNDADSFEDDRELPKILSGIKVGIPAAFSVSECPPSVTDAWSRGAEWLERHGAVVEHVSVDHISPEVLQKSLAAYYVLVSAEASSNLSRYDGFRYGVAANAAVVTDRDDAASQFSSVLERQYAATRTRGFGREVIRRVLCGTSVLSSDRFHTHYEAAAKLRAVLTNQLHQALSTNDDDGSGYDLLLVPTTVFPPPKTSDPVDETEMFANDIMTVPISLAGLPAISVPVGEWDSDAHFQVGLQLVAPRHGEAVLLRAAAVLERTTLLRSSAAG